MAEPVLRIRNLTKSFGALKATNGVSLDLQEGEIHALIGPNGAGKSTLVKQIVGEFRQDAGSIEFNGRSIDTLGPAARARLGLARSFQISCIVPEFTVLQNVILAAIGAKASVYRFFRDALSHRGYSDAAQECICRVGLGERVTSFAADLSHGERRRLEIAMALALQPRAFLLDEPMAGMGPEGSAQLTCLLSEIRRKAPILLIEHDMDAVFALANRISVLVYGQVIASGSVPEIRNNEDVRKAYLGEEEE